MKIRERLLIILVTATLLCSGCQPRSNLVVVNETDNPITVEYRYKGGVAGRAHKLPLKQFERADFEWTSHQGGDFDFNESTKTVKVVVAPYEALSIEYAHLDRGGRYDECALATIKIDGAEGSVVLEGQQIMKYFKPDVKNIDTLRYR